jgi:4-methylaminobutanoate oxidase (formaldehyde-forming)
VCSSDLWVGEECAAARASVALFDQTWLSKLLVVGADAVAFLQWVCVSDIDVPVGSIVRTVALGDDATLRADFVVVRQSETEFLVMSGTGQQVADLAYLRSQIAVGQSVSVVDVTSAWSVLYLAGPSSRELLASVTYADVSR